MWRTKWASAVTAAVSRRRCYCYKAWIQQQVDGLDLLDAPPESSAYANLLQECCEARALEPGKQLHQQLIRRGRHRERYIQNMLIQMYGKCGSLADALAMFDDIGDKTVFSWNTIIGACVENGEHLQALELYKQMDTTPSAATFVSVLRACLNLGSLSEVSAVNDRVRGLQLDTNPVVGSALVTALGRCGDLDAAKAAFMRMPFKDTVAWTSMITAFAQKGHDKQALTTFRFMVLEGVKPDAVTVGIVLDACSSMKSLQEGDRIYDLVICDTSLCYDISVGASLVNMYAKCGHLERAWKLFQMMPKKEVLAWNTMLTAFTQSGHYAKALTLYREGMRAKPDAVTFITLLEACTSMANLVEGASVHRDLVNHGLDADVGVVNALLSMYGRCGKLEHSRHMFDRMQVRNVASWNAMISLYLHLGLPKEVLELHRKMDIKPEVATFVGVLGAVGDLRDLDEGRLVHQRAIECGYETVPAVENSLLNMYIACGSMVEAANAFAGMLKKDVLAWNTMISAYSEHGEPRKALDLIPLMDINGVKPNEVTFVAIFSACTRAGMVDEAWNYFACMVDECGIEPSEKHYGCVIDLLARSGRFDCIKNVMPDQPSSMLWMIIVNACKMHGDVDRGEYAAERAIEVAPDDPAAYIALCDIYSAAQRWEDLTRTQKRMQARSLTYEPSVVGV